MKYLKVFTDFAIAIEPLNDAERGRLFSAMLTYAEESTEPELRGNERYVWGVAKVQIDRERDAYGRKVEGADSARKTLSEKNKQKTASEISLIPSDNRLISDDPALISEQDKEKEKEKKDKEKEKDRRSCAGAPAEGARAESRPEKSELPTEEESEAMANRFFEFARKFAVQGTRNTP